MSKNRDITNTRNARNREEKKKRDICFFAEGDICQE